MKTRKGLSYSTIATAIMVSFAAAVLLTLYMIVQPKPDSGFKSGYFALAPFLISIAAAYFFSGFGAKGAVSAGIKLGFAILVIVVVLVLYLAMQNNISDIGKILVGQIVQWFNKIPNP